MSTFNPIRWWIYLFKRNAFFSVLRMTSRLLLFPGYVFYFFLCAFLNVDLDPVNLFFYSYGLMVLLDVLFFEILGLKESRFKDTKAFFKKHRFSPKRIDWHARFITRVRVVSLAAIPFIASYFEAIPAELLLFFMIVFPVFSMEVYFRKVVKKQPLIKRYKAWADKDIQNHWRPNSSIGIDIRRSDSTTNFPPNFGVSGYNIAGIYTGSTTAVGGISN